MKLRNENDLTATREKLQRLELMYRDDGENFTDGAYAREVTLNCVKQIIDVLKTEIEMFEGKRKTAS